MSQATRRLGWWAMLALLAGAPGSLRANDEDMQRQQEEQRRQAEEALRRQDEAYRQDQQRQQEELNRQAEQQRRQLEDSRRREEEEAQRRAQEDYWWRQQQQRQEEVDRQEAERLRRQDEEIRRRNEADRRQPDAPALLPDVAALPRAIAPALARQAMAQRAFAGLDAQFIRRDATRDGFLSREELLAQFGLAQVEQALRTMDRDGDRKVSRAEYRQWALEYAEAHAARLGPR